MAVARSLELEISVVDMASSDIAAIDDSMDSVADTAEDAQGGITGMADRLGDLGGSIRDVGGAMTKYVTGPLVAAGAAIFGLATKTGYFADELLDLEATTGISTDTLQHFRAAEVSAGVEADSVAQGIMRMNRQMQESGEYNARVVRAAEQYGVSLHKTSGELRGAEGVTMDLMRSIAGIEDPQERARAGSEAFGRDWERIAPVVALGVDELDRMADAEVISAEQLEAANEFRRSWDELKREFSLVFMELGANLAPLLQDTLMPVLRDQLIPIIERVGEFIGRLIQWFADLDPRWQGIILGALGLAAVLGPVLLVVGQFFVMLPGIILALKGVGIALAFLSGPIGLIIGLVVALVAGIIYLWQTNETFRNVIIAIWEGIKAFVGAAIEAIQTTIDIVMALLRGDWEEAWQLISDWVMDIWETIKDYLGAAWDWLVAAAQEAWTNFVDSITERVTAAYESVKEWIGDAVDWLEGLPGRMLQAGKDMIQGLIDGIKAKATAVMDAIKELAGDIIDSFWGIFEFGSPSQLMMQFGQWMGEGLTLGVEGEERRIHEVWPRYAPDEGLRPAVATGGRGAFKPTINITVNGAGGDPQELARTINRQVRHTFKDQINLYFDRQRRTRG